MDNTSPATRIDGGRSGIFKCHICKRFVGVTEICTLLVDAPGSVPVSPAPTSYKAATRAAKSCWCLVHSSKFWQLVVHEWCEKVLPLFLNAILVPLVTPTEGLLGNGFLAPGLTPAHVLSFSTAWRPKTGLTFAGAASSEISHSSLGAPSSAPAPSAEIPTSTTEHPAKHKRSFEQGLSSRSPSDFRWPEPKT